MICNFVCIYGACACEITHLLVATQARAILFWASIEAKGLCFHPQCQEEGTDT